jgi:hypothetical protein
MTRGFRLFAAEIACYQPRASQETCGNRRRPMIPHRMPDRRTGLFALVALGLMAAPAAAEKVANPVAEFAGLDKITGRIISFDVYMDETVQFGALQVTPRACYNRPPTEEPQTDAFVEVDEIGLNRTVKRIFTGWMFASSPGLNAVDNAVYDVWLTDCKTTSDVAPPGSR